jgi:hypothetical protein
MGRPRKAGKRTKSGRLSRAGAVQEDPRDIVFLARRRRLNAALLDASVEIDKWRRAMSRPLTKEEKAFLSRAGDRLYELEMAGELHADQVGAGHDFAARYSRFAQTQGIPTRTAKVGSYGAVRGAPVEFDDEVCRRARDAHAADVDAIRAHALPGALDHLFAAVVEDRTADPAMIRSACDALIRLHRSGRKKYDHPLVG